MELREEAEWLPDLRGLDQLCGAGDGNGGEDRQQVEASRPCLGCFRTGNMWFLGWERALHWPGLDLELSHPTSPECHREVQSGGTLWLLLVDTKRKS